MPLHAYRCPNCDHVFDEFKKLHSEVQQTPCQQCDFTAEKSWEPGDVGVLDVMEPYYEEQLDAVISSRGGLRKAMDAIEAKHDGKVKLEYK
jgi:putative FmdB family regulatory protein